VFETTHRLSWCHIPGRQSFMRPFRNDSPGWTPTPSDANRQQPDANTADSLTYQTGHCAQCRPRRSTRRACAGSRPPRASHRPAARIQFAACQTQLHPLDTHAPAARRAGWRASAAAPTRPRRQSVSQRLARHRSRRLQSQRWWPAARTPARCLSIARSPARRPQRLLLCSAARRGRRHLGSRGCEPPAGRSSSLQRSSAAGGSGR